MFRHDIDRAVKNAKAIFLRELDIAIEFLGFPHPEDTRHQYPRRHHHHNDKHKVSTILFEYLFPNLSILQPMGIAKNNGAFDGALVFKNAKGDVIPISGVTNPALVVDPSSTGTGSVTLNPDGTFSGTGADGDVVLVATAVNDKGESITGTSTITFTAVVVTPDTTATSIDVNVN